MCVFPDFFNLYSSYTRMYVFMMEVIQFNTCELLQSAVWICFSPSFLIKLYRWSNSKRSCFFSAHVLYCRNPGLLEYVLGLSLFMIPFSCSLGSRCLILILWNASSLHSKIWPGSHYLQYVIVLFS